MNLLDLLQAYQGAQRNPSMMGPVPTQNPTPGFRAPPVMGIAMPHPQQQPGMPDLGGLGAALGMLGPHVGTGDTTPTAGTAPIPGMNPVDPSVMPSVSSIDGPSGIPGMPSQDALTRAYAQGQGIGNPNMPVGSDANPVLLGSTGGPGAGGGGFFGFLRGLF